MKNTPTSLIHHISRLEGQLASVKRELAQQEPDCTKAAATLRAASRSFSSLRAAFITCFVHTTLSKKSGERKIDSLLSLINS